MTEDIYSIYSYIHQARQVYSKGGNVSEFLRKSLKESVNTPEIIEVSYDLQSGSYIQHIRQFPEKHDAYSKEIANYIGKYIDSNTSLLEVGCGEMTTLLGVCTHLTEKPIHILGFDISLSRVKVGLDYWNSQNVQATKITFFVADLFHIPLADNSIDIVFTSHAIEPNGGKEVEALRSIFRVALKRVLLFEPYFENASVEGQARMLKHGYIRKLPQAIQEAGGILVDIRKMISIDNPLNPTYLFDISLNKKTTNPIDNLWIDPVISSPMIQKSDHFFCPDSGLAYPLIKGIPCLRVNNAILATHLD